MLVVELGEFFAGSGERFRQIVRRYQSTDDLFHCRLTIGGGVIIIIIAASMGSDSSSQIVV